MSQQLKNKIEATDTSINKLLKDQKFYIDYFQREYRWEEKHITQRLIAKIVNTALGRVVEKTQKLNVTNKSNYL